MVMIESECEMALIEGVDVSKDILGVALTGWVDGLVCTGVVAFFWLRYILLRRHVVAHQHRFRNTPRRILCIPGLRIRA